MIVSIIQKPESCVAYYGKMMVDPDCASFKFLNIPITDWDVSVWSALLEDVNLDESEVCVIGFDAKCKLPSCTLPGKKVECHYFPGHNGVQEYCAWMKDRNRIEEIPDQFADCPKISVKPNVSASGGQRAKKQVKRVKKDDIKNVPCVIKKSPIPSRAKCGSKGTVAEKTRCKKKVLAVGREKYLSAVSEQNNHVCGAEECEIERCKVVLENVGDESLVQCMSFTVADVKKICIEAMPEESVSDVCLYVYKSEGRSLYRYKVLVVLPDGREFCYGVFAIDPKINEQLIDRGGEFCPIRISI